MSDKLTLDALMLWRDEDIEPKDVSLADLVEVVESEGGEIVEAEDQGPYATLPFMQLEPGRYLVLRLEDEK